MLDFSWKVFSMTGSIDTYLILKEIERDTLQSTEEMNEKLDEIDAPTSWPLFAFLKGMVIEVCYKR